MAATSKFTPGPWTVRVATASIPTMHVMSPRGYFASVHGARHVQDAHLMAAAPDLLEVAEDALKALPVLRTLLESAGLAAGVIVAEGMIEHTRAAIAKAKFA